MNSHGAAITTFVVWGHVVVLELDMLDLPRSLGVTLHLNGRRLRSFEEPGWKPLGYGVSDREFYWWSARRLVALGLPSPPEDQGASFDQFDVDEDILEVFCLSPGWLFVCETSLRLVVEHRETARLQYPEVVVEAYLEGDQIIVQEADGRLSRVDIDVHNLRLADR
jgi:hypothetical protein